MTEEIKEILHLLKRCDNTYLKIENSNGEKEYEYHQVNDLRLDGYHSQLLLDYITNLQQDLEKANKIIEKDRQFYKCRMDEYVELKKENDKIKRNLFCTEDKFIDNYIKHLEEEKECYKSRCKKAIEELIYMSTDAYTDNYDIRDIHYNLLMNILQGSDENE